MGRMSRVFSRWMAGRAAGRQGSVTVWEALSEELCAQHEDPELELAAAEYRREHASGCSGNGTDSFRKSVISRLHAARNTTLCFSGGGIRSATFGLGVLQGLAAHSCDRAGERPLQLLGEINYLSTVSGGGYLGAWFSAWAAREGTANVIEQLASPPQSEWEPEPRPLRRLRTFANYLNPQLGLFSADTWTLAATIVRNIFLNFLVLLPIISAVMVLPRILYKLVIDVPDDPWGYLLPSAAVLLVVAVAYMVMDLPSAGNARLSQRSFVTFGLIPLVLSSIGFVMYWAWEGILNSQPSAVIGFAGYGIAIMAAGSAIGLVFAITRHKKLDFKWIINGVGFSIVAGAIGGLFAFAMTLAFTDPTNQLYSNRIYTWLAMPTLLGVFAVSQAVLVGLSSSITGDEDREWFARATAWLMIATVCSLGFTGIALMPPVTARWLPAIHWQALATLATGGMASWLGRSPATPSTKEKKAEKMRTPSIAERLTPFASKIVMVLFLMALLALIATFNDVASQQLTQWLKNPPSWSPFAAVSDPDPAWVECLLALLLVVPSLLLSRVIDANKFSLHAMYRNRLIRTFLGASNVTRNPNPFTGFDPEDNVLMSQLPAKPCTW